ncbi:hypothetical protein QTH97_30065 [Variovorax sp. J22R24]|uniref:hypothetical protein n=1 Tax=Variovorax gracilis TaxID=3053502 RepID=UPI002578D8DD|nr:hypothetical protein [Variovorax sp. J22R24]MDM0109218.1 hypothetical protein [Variovorax sp. J22R24]
MNIDIKLGYLKDEYLLLQKLYEDYDARAITIKGWSATVGLAAIGVGFYQSRYLWLFAAGAAMVFWCLEALWKGFQYMYEPRIRLLEAAFLADDFDGIAPLQVYTAWHDEYQAKGLRVWRNMRMPLVAFPHVVTLVTGLVLFVVDAAGVAALRPK